MKTLALIARRRDLSRDAFRAHYEDVHAPLAIATLLEGTTRYVRHHLREELFGRPGFDVVTAFWYRDAAAASEVLRRSQAPEGEAIRRDEESFMDRAANTFFAATEHVVHGAEDRAAPLAAIALVRRPAGDAPDAFTKAYEAEWIPRLLAATRDPRWCLQNRALRVVPSDPAFDAATHVHATADAGLAEWAKALAATGAGVVLATVLECESALPWQSGR